MICNCIFSVREENFSYIYGLVNSISKRMKTSGNRPEHIIVIFFFLFSAIAAYSQNESVLYIGKTGRLTSQEHADTMQKIRHKSDKITLVQSFRFNESKWEKIYTERFKRVNDSTFRIKGSSKTETRTSYRIFKTMADGTFRFKDIHKNKLLREGFTSSKIPLSILGQLTEYYKSGRKKSISEYQNNELISNQNWNESGEKYIDNIFYSVDEEPAFIPGNNVLHQYLLKEFKDAGIDLSSISGSIIIGFVVMEDGTIDGIKILKGILPTINTVAYQSFVNLKGEWKPAKLNNQNVRYFQVFPINFINKEQHFEFAEMRGSTLHWAAF